MSSLGTRGEGHAMNRVFLMAALALPLAAAHAGAQRGLRVHSGCDTRSQNTGNAGIFDQGTTIHGFTPKIVE